DTTKIFHFDASAESLYGIHQKFLFLKKRNVPVKNCLIILDYALLSKTENQEGHIVRKHYLLTGESKFDFQFLFFKAYLDRNFLRAYYDLKITHHFKPYMQKVMLRKTFDYEPVTNELQLKSDEAAIGNGTFYNKKKINTFARKDTLTTKISPPVIDSMQWSFLNDIKSILVEDAADYKIIISPLYHQKYLNPADVKKLKDIFGPENVFDFSGKNKFTDDYRNYYDIIHYRPTVTRGILKMIYQKQ
ncbi:MAG: hypothetical protein ABIT08_01885, partial [Bacteroidia bacterium]